MFGSRVVRSRYLVLLFISLIFPARYFLFESDFDALCMALARPLRLPLLFLLPPPCLVDPRRRLAVGVEIFRK